MDKIANLTNEEFNNLFNQLSATEIDELIEKLNELKEMFNSSNKEEDK